MELTAAEAWSHILTKARAEIPETPFRMWLEPTRPVALSHDILAVQVASEFVAQWIEDKYADVLAATAQKLFGRRVKISFEYDSDADVSPQRPEAWPRPEPVAEALRPRAVATPRVHVGAALNERYTFERFVVGSYNQLAAAGAKAVAEASGRTYNPLFIYGGVGLGKTHLMHAIAHAVLARKPATRVAYVSSEQFTNELIGAIQSNRTAEFRRRYRDIDLLLLDDVHFLREKERTQDEFFHTFNALYDAQRQIVLTSDRPPNEIPGLERRLVSRFAWGLVTDIMPPDLETRIAILRKKAEDDEITLDDEILEFIARNCRSSVRELEGAIIKLLAYSSLTRREINMDLAAEALGGILGPEAGRAARTPAGVKARVAEAWGVAVQGLESKSRTRNLAVPRHIAMYLIREIFHVPLVEIGRLFGDRDHSTVIYSIHKIEEAMKGDDKLASRVESIRSEFGSERG